MNSISSWAATVNWDAWSAIGSLGAVWAAIWLANRGFRDARERDMATIEAIIVLANGLKDVYRGRSNRDLPVDPIDPDQLNVFAQLRLLIENIKVTELPTRVTADAFMVIATNAQMTDSVMRVVASGNGAREAIPNHCHRAMLSMEQQVVRLEGEIFRLKHPLRLAAARLTARLLVRSKKV